MREVMVFTAIVCCASAAAGLIVLTGMLVFHREATK